MDSSLIEIADKITAGRRLRESEVVAVMATNDLLAIGRLADEARRQRHGDRITFVRVAEIRVTDDPQTRKQKELMTAGELRIVGSPPSFGRALSFVRAVVNVSDGTPVTGFSLNDLEKLCTVESMRLEDALSQLRDAGLALISEAEVEQLQDPLTVFSTAGRVGLGVARLTISTVEVSARLSLFQRVAGWQTVAGVVRAFVPLPRAVSREWPSTGYDDIRQVVLARLLVDNIESIQVDWRQSGPKLAQVALTFGADDVDGVSPVDTSDLGRRRTAIAEIRRNIEAASFVPVERNGYFEPLR